MIVETGSQETAVPKNSHQVIPQTAEAVKNNAEDTSQPSSTQPVPKISVEEEKQSSTASVVSAAESLGNTLKQAVPLTREAVKSLGDKLSESYYSQRPTTSTIAAHKGSPVVSVAETEDGHKVIKIGPYYVLFEKITNISIRVLSALYMIAVVVAALIGPKMLLKLIWRCWILCILFGYLVGKMGLQDEVPDLFMALHWDLLEVLAGFIVQLLGYKDFVLDLAEEKKAGCLRLE